VRPNFSGRNVQASVAWETPPADLLAQMDLDEDGWQVIPSTLAGEIGTTLDVKSAAAPWKFAS